MLCCTSIKILYFSFFTHEPFLISCTPLYFSAPIAFVSLVRAIHLPMDSLQSGASKGAATLQTPQTTSRHRCHPAAFTALWLTVEETIKPKILWAWAKGAMNLLLSLTVFCLLPLALMAKENLPLNCIPRRSVPYHSKCCSFVLCNLQLDLQCVSLC